MCLYIYIKCLWLLVSYGLFTLANFACNFACNFDTDKPLQPIVMHLYKCAYKYNVCGFKSHLTGYRLHSSRYQLAALLLGEGSK